MKETNLNSAMQVMYHSRTHDKRKFKALIRKKLSALSSDEANGIVADCIEIDKTIHALASKYFGNEKLTDDEAGYLDALPLDEALKSKLWQGAMFTQFR